jgi:hypothetical protein
MNCDWCGRYFTNQPKTAGIFAFCGGKCLRDWKRRAGRPGAAKPGGWSDDGNA